MSVPIRVVFLSSGEGQLFEATVTGLREAGLVDVMALVTQNSKAGCVKRAQTLGVPTIIVDKAPDSYESSIHSILVKLAPDYIVLTGFTRLIPEATVQFFEKRIFNSHPSLLPKYGGKGMYGRRVHEAVLQAKEKTTGITLHVVTSKFDEGPVISQVEVPVQVDDTVETLEQRVKVMEREFLPQALLLWWKRASKKS